MLTTKLMSSNNTDVSHLPRSADLGAGGDLTQVSKLGPGGEGLIPAHVWAPPAMPLLPPECSPIWLTPQRAKNLPSKGLFCHNEFWMFLSSERNEACSPTLCTDNEWGDPSMRCEEHLPTHRQGLCWVGFW